MVSPIKTFRKHRKLMLAVLTLMAMLSFVFLPVVGEILSLRRGTRDKVVVTTKKYGNLTESQINSLLGQRGRWITFLRELRQLTRANGGRDFGEPSLPESEEAVVETWLLSRKAREMGITISNPAINRLLSDLTQNRVDDREIGAMLKSLRLPQSLLFEIVRNELSATRLREMLTMDLAGVTPAQRWDYFLRLNRKAKIEAVPIDAEKLIAKVPDPTEEDEKDLKNLFEEYKDKRPDPNSPEPAFRVPHRIALEYFKAEPRSREGTASPFLKLMGSSPWALDLAVRGVIGVQARNDFLDPDEVTDAEILAHYNEHKDQYRQWVFPEAKVLPEKPPAPGEKKPAEPAKPVAPKGEPAKALEPKGAPEKPGPAEKVPAKTSSSSNRTEGPLRLVSFQKEKEKESAAERPAPKTEAAVPKGAEAKPKTEAAIRKGQAPAKTEPSAAKAGRPAEKPQPRPSPKFELQPLEEVKDQIRDKLARQKASQRIAAAFTVLQDEMARFERGWMAYESLEKSRREKESPPQPPNLDSVAKRHGLKPVRTGVISALDAERWDIAKSRVEGRSLFAERAFGSLALYRAVTSQDPYGNEYVFWKVEDYPERVPEWDDEGVRDRVVRAWKLLRARERVLEEAERLAARARELRKPLQDVVGKRPDTVVLTPPAFAWLTRRDVYGTSPGEPPRLGEILGRDGKPIPALGNPFMEKLFAIPQGGADWVWNHPETAIYVVRVVEYLPLETTLWEDFLASPWWTYSQGALFDQQAALAAWKKDLFAEAGLEWQREPARGRAAAEGPD